MGKAEENKKKKRNSLLSNAFSLFMNQGIANTSISEIAHASGVGKGTFYFYFKDKEDLVDKLIAQKAEQLLSEALQDLKQHPEIKSVEDKFIFIADWLLNALQKNARLLQFINKNLNYGFFAKAFNRDEIKKELDVAALYHEIITEDGSTWKDPELMLYTCIELVSSTCHSIILKKDPVDLETYKPYLFESLRCIVNVFRV